MAAGFSYLLMAYGDLTLTETAGLGLIGAIVAQATSLLVAAHAVPSVVQTNSSAEASIQSDSQDSGGHSNSSPGISHS